MSRLNPLKALLGSRIVKAEVVEDYLQLWFDDGAVLNVYNEHEITGPAGKVHHSDDLLNASLVQVNENGPQIRLTFSNRLDLSIDMSEEGYLGPEAIELNREDAPTVVWRLDD